MNKNLSSILNRKKLLQKVLSGSKNISFADFSKLVNSFGFRLDRTSGSHHIFVHPELNEIINIQEIKGKAKPYQINQFLKIVEKYNLELED